MNVITVEDADSFTVLQDASAAAINDSRGAHGVLLLYTTKGRVGQVNSNCRRGGFYSQFTKLPDFVDGYTYASMANEARTTRNQEPFYSPTELELLRHGLDTDRFANVDWMDVLMRDAAWSKRSVLSFSGGGKTARYY